MTPKARQQIHEERKTLEGLADLIYRALPSQKHYSTQLRRRTNMTEHAAGIATNTLVRLLENVREDPDLSPGERETQVRWARDDDRVHVYTESTALLSSLLLHPEFAVEELRVSDEDRFGARVRPSEYQGGEVTGIGGTLDIGALKILGTARSTKQHSKVISDTVRENDPRRSESNGGEFP